MYHDKDQPNGDLDEEVLNDVTIDNNNTENEEGLEASVEEQTNSPLSHLYINLGPEDHELFEWTPQGNNVNFTSGIVGDLCGESVEKKTTSIYDFQDL